MKRVILRIVVFGVLAGVFAMSPAVVLGEDNGIAALRQQSKAFTEVAKKTLPAVVSITVEKTVQPSGAQNPHDDFLEFFFGGRRQHPRTQKGLGSGFIISSDGYILTNNHVVGTADKIRVLLNDGRTLDAEIVGVDPDTDVAVIKVDATGLPVIKLGDSDELEIGEWAIAVGNPFGLAETVTVGVISAKGRSGFGINRGGYEDFIQTDAAINPGNSGGPLINLDGEAIGINTFIFSKSGGYMGIGFAVPINMAARVKDQLIKSGEVTHGFLGIHMYNVDEGVAKFFGLEEGGGVIITEIDEGSPAEDAGLEKDDIILKIDGDKIEDARDVRNTIAFIEPGTKINLTVWRNNKEKKIRVTVGSQEESALTAKKLGLLKVKEVDQEIAGKFGYKEGQGVIVVDIKKGSAAENADIRTGMLIVRVNRRDVGTVAEFNEALKRTEETGKALLEVSNGQFVWYEVLTLE
jgi:serine protease Do